MTNPTQNPDQKSQQSRKADDKSWRLNGSIVVLCLSIVGGMAGLSYAAVPLYRIFCQVTGYGGTTQKADGFTGTISDTVINVSFDANISKALDWEFKPKKRSISIRLGEKATAIYLAKNTGKNQSTGEATFNVSPQAAGQYFNKIECFCFTEQTLASNEAVEMPVLFFIDPEIENDPLMKNITTITLSYTMYPTNVDDKSASLDIQPTSAASDNPVNNVSKLQ